MKTIQLTDEQYNALKNGESITLEPPKKGPWKPEKGKAYWHVTSMGFTADSATYHANGADRGRLAFGNIFSSEENAQKASKVMRTHNRILQYIIENDSDWEADWNDRSQKKWFIRFNHDENKWKSDYNTYSQKAGGLYCSHQCCDELVELLNNGWLEENT